MWYVLSNVSKYYFDLLVQLWIKICTSPEFLQEYCGATQILTNVNTGRRSTVDTGFHLS